MARRIARGDIWMYEFRRPDKIRPVVVLTRDEVVESMYSVVVAPVTSTIRGLLSEVSVGTAEGLKRDSVVNLDHISNVERSKLARYVGSLSERKLNVTQAHLRARRGAHPRPLGKPRLLGRLGKIDLNLSLEDLARLRSDG